LSLNLNVSKYKWCGVAVLRCCGLLILIAIFFGDYNFSPYICSMRKNINTNDYNNHIMKQTSFTLLLAVLMSMVGLQAFADFDTSYSVVVNGLDYYLDNDNLQAEVKSKSVGGYYTGDIVIPSSITHEAKTYSVTSIGQNAFAGCSGLTSVSIPNSVTSVGSNAFIGSSWYDNQPNGVVYAGLNVYKYKGTMPQNTSITIEQGTVSISPSAFYECYGLTSITIPNSVMRIGGSAFNGCSGLASVTIPNSVTSIGNAAFNMTIRPQRLGRILALSWL